MPNSETLKTGMTNLQEGFLSCVDTHGMLPKGAKVCVALSGGKDSVTLLHLLHTLPAERAVNICAVHINHGIRGCEADRDETFCRELCKAMNVPLTVHKLDIPAMAKASGKGIEECARDARYEIFDKMLENGEVDRVATAHHAADSAETVLFNLARGSSLRGARGIPAVRGGYIRPMIEMQPESIADYVKANGLLYVTDSTNFDTNYTRNLIRAKVLPVMREVNGGFLEHVRSFSACAEADCDYLDRVAQNEKTDEIAVLMTMHEAILKRVLSLLAGECALTAFHLNAMAELVKNGSQGQRVSLPGNMCAMIDRGRLLVRRGQRAEEFCYELHPGVNRFPQIGCTVILSEGPLYEDSLNIYKKSIYANVKRDKMYGVHIRSRQEGDAYRCMGMTRRVKKLIQSDKLTAKERESLPVFCDTEGVLWVPGHGVRDGVWDPDGAYIYYCVE